MRKRAVRGRRAPSKDLLPRLAIVAGAVSAGVARLNPSQANACPPPGKRPSAFDAVACRGLKVRQAEPRGHLPPAPLVALDADDFPAAAFAGAVAPALEVFPLPLLSPVGFDPLLEAVALLPVPAPAPLVAGALAGALPPVP